MFKATEASTGGSSKIIQPGGRLCRIVDVTIETPPYDANNRQIILTLEGVDMGDGFEGVDVDKENPSLGKYRGQVAKVKHDMYDIKDFEWQGDTIAKETQIFNWFNRLARKLGVLSEMNSNNVSGETIEEYIDNAKKYLISPDRWALFTIAGKEYYTEGYDKPNYRLFLASKSMLDKEDRVKYKNKDAFVLSDDDKSISDLENDPGYIKFDPEIHIIKAKQPEAATEIDAFAANMASKAHSNGMATGSDLDLP